HPVDRLARRRRLETVAPRAARRGRDHRGPAARQPRRRLTLTRDPHDPRRPTMPQYMLSVCHAEPYEDLNFDDPEIQRMVASVSALNEELQAKGAWVFGAGLRPSPPQRSCGATAVRS